VVHAIEESRLMKIAVVGWRKIGTLSAGSDDRAFPHSVPDVTFHSQQRLLVDKRA
jgi:hypothetical protein